MISDSTLYSLSVFLGSLAMLLIILYHFLEVNAREDGDNDDPSSSSAVTAGLTDEKVGFGAVKPASTATAGGGAAARSGNASLGKSVTANKGRGS